ncbi:MAG: hypothetical protein AB7F64_06740 [Gammaproteobacteria bacterium]
MVSVNLYDAYGKTIIDYANSSKNQLLKDTINTAADIMLSSLIENKHANSDDYKLLAKTYAFQRKIMLAIETYESVLKLGFQDPELHYELAKLYHMFAQEYHSIESEEQAELHRALALSLTREPDYPLSELVSQHGISFIFQQ